MLQAAVDLLVRLALWVELDGLRIVGQWMAEASKILYSTGIMGKVLSSSLSLCF
jgi:hypothetical protein